MGLPTHLFSLFRSYWSDWWYVDQDPMGSHVWQCSGGGRSRGQELQSGELVSTNPTNAHPESKVVNWWAYVQLMRTQNQSGGLVSTRPTNAHTESKWWAGECTSNQCAHRLRVVSWWVHVQPMRTQNQSDELVSIRPTNAHTESKVVN